MEIQAVFNNALKKMEAARDKFLAPTTGNDPAVSQAAEVDQVSVIDQATGEPDNTYIDQSESLTISTSSETSPYGIADVARSASPPLLIPGAKEFLDRPNVRVLAAATKVKSPFKQPEQPGEVSPTSAKSAQRGSNPTEDTTDLMFNLDEL